MEKFIERCREWQKENPDWELICDIHDTDFLYVQWSEIPKAARMSWIGKYRDGAKEMFEEYGIKQCKVERMALDSDMRLCTKWPVGNAMTVYRTSIDGVPILDC